MDKEMFNEIKVDGQALTDSISQAISNSGSYVGYLNDNGTISSFDWVTNLGTIKATSVEEYEWIEQADGSHYCSHCGRDALYDGYEQKEVLSNYCPYCGKPLLQPLPF